MLARIAPAPVSLEVGSKKVFASSLDWPGWCRPGRTEEAAVEALRAYAGRYSAVAAAAGMRFPSTAGRSFDVVEWVKGPATTDFGVPGEAASAGAEPLTASRAERLASLVASWVVLAAVARSAPAQLRKGPRGGGRDRDGIVAHVASSEFGYARKLGVRHDGPVDPLAVPDTAEAAGRGPGGAALGAEGRAGGRQRVAAPLRRPPLRLARRRPRLGDRGPLRPRLRMAEGRALRAGRRPRWTPTPW